MVLDSFPEVFFWSVSDITQKIFLSLFPSNKNRKKNERFQLDPLTLYEYDVKKKKKRRNLWAPAGSSWGQVTHIHAGRTRCRTRQWTEEERKSLVVTFLFC